ncbi:MAG TPA: PAS domain S-box protein [Opitutaceae bacterium]|nr:PAS domain S-box protein [Opitutaceae bacterium]
MPREIQILIVEDMPADVVLINHELRKGGLSFRTVRVQTRDEFVRALQGPPPDIILSDHGLPEFDGFSALELARQHVPEVPFLFVTGSMGEEVAIESLRQGATDYVLKSRLDTLAQAVRRALRLAEERRRRREAERALRESEDHFRTLVESVKDYAIFMLDLTGHVTTWSSGVEFILGYRAPDILGCPYEILFDVHEIEQRIPQRLLDSAASSGRVEWEGSCLRRSGPRFHASIVLTALRQAEGHLRGFSVILRDESERYRAAEELRRSEARHTAILESAIDAIVSIDHEGIVREWNAAAERLFQYSREDAVGRKIDALIVTPELLGLYREGLAKYLVTGVGSLIGRPIEMKARRADGTEFPVELGVSRIPGSSPALYSAVVRDITAHKAAVEEVARLNAELEQRVRERTHELETANQELESFSYSVSHDLRAPLRHITGFVTMLQTQSAERLDDPGRELLANIAAAAARMSRLIEALLVFSRTGRMDLHRQPVALDELVRSVQAELKGEQRGRRVEWRIGELPRVDGDPDLLRQVVVNLLSNALKYTRPRAVAKIEVAARRAGGEVLGYVKDNGVGFDARYADKLFGVFQRLHRPSEFEGTGIGLATVRLIVQRHGGRVWAEGEPGKGATFHFALPATREEAAP